MYPGLDMVMGEKERVTYSIKGQDPRSAKAHIFHEVNYHFDVGSNSPQKVEIHTNSEMRGDEVNFVLQNDLRVELNGKLFFERTWNEKIPRNHV